MVSCRGAWVFEGRMCNLGWLRYWRQHWGGASQQAARTEGPVDHTGLGGSKDLHLKEIN